MNTHLRRGLEKRRIPLSIAKSDHVCGLRVTRSYDNSVVCSRRYEMRYYIHITAQDVRERKLNLIQRNLLHFSTSKNRKRISSQRLRYRLLRLLLIEHCEPLAPTSINSSFITMLLLTSMLQKETENR